MIKRTWPAVFIAILSIATIAWGQTTTDSGDPTARSVARPSGEAATRAVVHVEGEGARKAATRASTQPGEAGDKVSVTDHEMALAGKTIKYTATAGTLVQKDEAGKAKADMFFVAYVVNDAPEGKRPTTRPSDASSRPVTFVFNGGPGAASVWLHLGTVGPKRVNVNDQGLAPVGGRAKWELVDNAETWLGFTDLVFIDPVGTGYSRPAPGEKGEEFYGVKEDVRSVGEFIRLWTTRNNRWTSPKFLAGESYGTTRAAGLSDYLLEGPGIGLDGIVLISSVLNFEVLSPEHGNELPYALFLPSYTATAWYHKKLAADLQGRPLADVLKEVETWTMGEYLAALGVGDGLDDSHRQAVAAKLARYTSLPADWILKGNLRIEPERFEKQLLASDRKIVGRFDGRVTGFDSDPLADSPGYDPSYSLVEPLYAAGFNQYVRGELKYESDLPYEVISPHVQPWNFGKFGTGYLNVAEDLRDAILRNPKMRVMVAEGRMDLATPYFSQEYTFGHLGLPAELRGNVVQKHYESGHMVYHVAAARKQMHADVQAFIEHQQE